MICTGEEIHHKKVKKNAKKKLCANYLLCRVWSLTDMQDIIAKISNITKKLFF